MASRSARRRKAATKAATKAAAASRDATLTESFANGSGAYQDSPVLPLAVSYRDPAGEPPIVAWLLDEFGGLPDPPGTVWAQPADLSRRGMARAFLVLWPDARSAVMAAADDPTLSDDPAPDPYDWALAFARTDDVEAIHA